MRKKYFRWAKRQEANLLLFDMKLDKDANIDLIKYFHELDPDICVIILTKEVQLGSVVQAMKAGAYDVIQTPLAPGKFILVAKNAIEKTKLAREASRCKKERELIERRFITFVSHQLQTPLSAVRQYLDFLQHLGDDPQKEKIKKDWIKRSIFLVNEMITIIQDWLRYSKIECGQLSDDFKPISIRPILEKLIRVYEEKAKEKGITIMSHISKKISPIMGHQECLRILFSNLINNAIKYNKPNGKITIKAIEDDRNVIISISDTGIGIPEDKREVIFEEFYRIKNPNTKNIPGTGLGLAVCKKIVSEFGGCIKVESKINEGSTFTVIFAKS